MRTIDRVIDYIRAMDNSGGMSDTIKQVLINRLNEEPTRAELDRAREELYGIKPQQETHAEYMTRLGW